MGDIFLLKEWVQGDRGARDGGRLEKQEGGTLGG